MHTRELTRHAVALAGRVIDDGTGRPVQGARVDILQGPPAFELLRRALAGAPDWDMRTQRLDRALCRADGLFYFLDLPDGTYRLQATAPAWGTRYGQTPPADVVTATRDTGGRLQLTPAELRLPPTRVLGRVIRTDGQAPVAGARVGLRGDTTAAITAADGSYVLAGLTATAVQGPQPTIVATAPGFRPGSQAVVLVQGQDKEVNFALEAVTP